MKQIKCLIYMHVSGGIHHPGDIVECPEEQAKALVAVGHAEYYDPASGEPVKALSTADRKPATKKARKFDK